LAFLPRKIDDDAVTRQTLLDDPSRGSIPFRAHTVCILRLMP
jgi:hypothetical protein